MPIPTIQGQAGVITDVEMRFTQSNKAVANVRLAFNDSKYNEDTRQWENTSTLYLDATAWEHTAERMAEHVKKGDQVYVEGRLKTQEWEDKQTGQKRSKPLLQLRTIRKFEKLSAQGQSSTGGQGTSSAQPQQSTPQQWGQASAQSDPWGGGQQSAWPSEPGGPAPF